MITVEGRCGSPPVVQPMMELIRIVEFAAVSKLPAKPGLAPTEVGDFQRALELDREAAELGQRHKIGNVEVSAQINMTETSSARASPTACADLR